MSAHSPAPPAAPPVGVIVEAGFGHRRLDAADSRPLSLEPAGDGDSAAMDWVLASFRRQGVAGVTYAGCYHIEKIVARYPDLSFRYRPRLETGEAGLLAGALAGGGAGGGAGAAVIVVRGGLLLLAGALERLAGDGSAMGDPVATGPVMGVWAENGDAFAGVMILPANLTAIAATLAAALPGSARLDDLITRLEVDGHRFRRVALDGLAAPVTDRAAAARSIFRGKARTLENVGLVARQSVVLDQIRFTADDWRRDPQAALARIAAAYPDGRLVVRSSTVDEDSHTGSGAGRFLSVLDVAGDDPAAVSDAVARVVASYAGGDRDAPGHDEILVQRQVEGLVSSGVLLTRDPRSAAPYLVINIDRCSQRSDVVTSGGAGRIDAYYVSWTADPTGLEPDIARLVAATRELTALTRLDALDIEFGFDAAGTCYLFQVRPMTGGGAAAFAAEEDFPALLDEVERFVAGRMGPHPLLAGPTTLLGTMPDWNPAEILGPSPRPLALSLYQELVGDDAWAEARARLGYRDVRPEPLILSLGGRPYVDVRTSLNSFLPAGLPVGAAERWIAACLERLRADPSRHDKIEFDVTVTCMAPDWPQKAGWMADAGLDAAEIDLFRQLLTARTNAMLRGEVEPTAQQMATLAQMGERRRALSAAGGGADDPGTLLRTARQLLADCRRYGVVAFSILARYGFVAMTLLRGLRDVGAISAEDYELFLRRAPTVAGAFSADLAAAAAGEISRDELLARYGHLRPNSYEITSPAYAEAPDLYLRWSAGAAPAAAHQGESAAAHQGSPVAAQHQDTPEAALLARAVPVADALRALGLWDDVAGVAGFMAGAVAGREFGKFEFMKNLDAALGLTARACALLGLDREETSMLTYRDLAGFETDSIPVNCGRQLRRQVNYRDKRHRLTQGLRLPDLIVSPVDVRWFRQQEWTPNFITRKQARGRPVRVDRPDPNVDLAGAIVVIDAADPGYDWLFGHGVAGLITRYGGVASHMAIRAAEFGLPAAIGCGAAVFDDLADATMVELDCDAQRIRRLA
jgi:glutamine kinase